VRVVVALGGNALLRRGEPMTIERQRANVDVACDRLAPLAEVHELVISHGNGPQVGLLAIEGAAYEEVPTYPLDVLVAETQGMVGYLVELGLRNRLRGRRPVATLLSVVEVGADDPAFQAPSKPIGPLYDQAAADRLAAERGWTFRPDGGAVRRVVSSPQPRRLFEEGQIASLLKGGCTVICAGGGGIPVVNRGDLVGVEAVVDKDASSAMLAEALAADVFVMATDTPAAYLGFGTPDQAAITAANPEALLSAHASAFADGSMLPKVTAACAFAQATGHPAMIGQLDDIERLVEGRAGSRIAVDVEGVVTELER